MAPAIRDRDHTGHDVAGQPHRQLDGAVRRADPHHVTVPDPQPGRVVDVHQRTVILRAAATPVNSIGESPCLVGSLCLGLPRVRRSASVFGEVVHPVRKPPALQFAVHQRAG